MTKCLYLCKSIDRIDMHKLRVKLYITVVLLFLSIACVRSPRHAEQIMEQAKSCMNESADSALHLLQTISSPQTLRGKERADYALLYTQACDKNNMVVADDSLIRIAVDYYGEEKSMNAALSYFYLGCVNWNKGSNVDAAKAFLKALDIFPPRATTDRLLMQIHVYLGECYNWEGFYQEAKGHYSLAYQNALFRKDTLDMYYPLCGLGESCLYLNLNDSALSFYNKALDISRYYRNVDMEKSVLYSLVGYYEVMHEYAGVYQYANRLIELGDDDLTDIYRAKGNALMDMERLDSVYYYLKLSTLSEDLNTRTMSYYSLYELLKKKHDIKLTEYVDSFIMYKDSLNLADRYNEIQKLKSDHLEQVRQREYLQHRNKLKLYFLALCLLFGLLGVIIVLIIEKRRKQHYVELQQKLADNKLDNIKRYMKEQFGETVEVETKLRELEEEETKTYIVSFQHTVWYKKIANLDKEWLSAKEQRELYKDLSVLFAGLIETLQGEYPAIKEVDIYFCIMSVIGYKLKTIAACLRTTDRNLSTRKSRMKKVLSKNTFDIIFSKSLNTI